MKISSKNYDPKHYVKIPQEYIRDLLDPLKLHKRRDKKFMVALYFISKYRYEIQLENTLAKYQSVRQNLVNIRRLDLYYIDLEPALAEDLILDDEFYRLLQIAYPQKVTNLQFMMYEFIMNIDLVEYADVERQAEDSDTTVYYCNKVAEKFNIPEVRLPEYNKNDYDSGYCCSDCDGDFESYCAYKYYFATISRRDKVRDIIKNKIIYKAKKKKK